MRGRLVELLALLASVGLAAAWLFLWLPGLPPETFTATIEGEPWRLAEPRALCLVALLPWLVVVAVRSLSALPLWRRLLSAVVRLAVVAALALALAQPETVEEHQRLCAVAVLDVSTSVSDESLVLALDDLQAFRAAAPADAELHFVTFATGARLAQWGAPGEAMPDVAGLRHAEGSDGSDLEAGLALARGLCSSDRIRRVLVVSDGLETRGDAVAEAGRMTSDGTRVWVRSTRAPPPAEVAVSAVHLPTRIEVGRPFTVRVELSSTRAATAKLRLWQGDVLNGLEGERRVELPEGTSEHTFDSVVHVGGPVTYRAELAELADDEFSENDALAVTADVPGRPAILVVDGEPDRAKWLRGALAAQQFDVDVRQPEAFPAGLEELSRFELVFLSDVPRARLGEEPQRLLGRYLSELGGGLVYAGGESGYSLGGWADSPLEAVLPVRMTSDSERREPDAAMVLVIDRSGSMSGQPLEMAKAACVAAVESLGPDDLVGVVAFDSSAARFVKLQRARYRTRIAGEVAQITAGGGTAIFRGLDLAHRELTSARARRKHVVLLTDGVSDEAGIRELAQTMVLDGITVTTVSLGGSVDAELLRDVADAGGGRYHAVPTPDRLPRVFVQEAETITREAAVDEWFPVRQAAPAAFLAGVGVADAPLLRGYVSVRMKPSPAQLVLSTDEGEPILARWRHGRGWALAWTSDLKNRWAVDWLRWSGFGRFWAQLVREHMRTDDRTVLPMEVWLHQGVVHAAVDALTEDGEFDDTLESELQLRGPMPSDDRLSAPFRAVAPGRYEAELPLPSFGSYLLDAKHLREGTDGLFRRAVSHGAVTWPYSEEYARFRPDRARLAALAAAARGRLDDEAAAPWAVDGERLRHAVSRWDIPLWVAIGLYLFDLFARRASLPRWRTRVGPPAQSGARGPRAPRRAGPTVDGSAERPEVLAAKSPV